MFNEYLLVAFLFVHVLKLHLRIQSFIEGCWKNEISFPRARKSLFISAFVFVWMVAFVLFGGSQYGVVIILSILFLDHFGKWIMWLPPLVALDFLGLTLGMYLVFQVPPIYHIEIGFIGTAVCIKQLFGSNRLDHIWYWIAMCWVCLGLCEQIDSRVGTEAVLTALNIIYVAAYYFLTKSNEKVFYTFDLEDAPGSVLFVYQAALSCLCLGAVKFLMSYLMNGEYLRFLGAGAVISLVIASSWPQLRIENKIVKRESIPN